MADPSSPEVHLVLVSDQAVPAITPALDPSFQPKEVVFLVSPDKHPKARWLGEVLRPRGIRTSEWTIADAWDIVGVRERVWELLEARDGESVALNATGGTKPMSIAAYEVFRDWDRPIFYVHPEQDRVVWMHPADRPSFHLADRLRLEPFLQAYGAKIEGQIERSPVDSGRFELARRLVIELPRFGRPLRRLNWLAQEARNASRSARVALSEEDLDSRAFCDLLDVFAGAGLLAVEDARLRFAGEPERFFVNGGWLEEYVFGTLHRLRNKRPDIQDLGRRIEVCRETSRGEVPNELDVALLADNRFYLIECKARQWRNPTGREAQSPGAESLYKLDALKDLLGGLQARALLVSYQDLPRYDRTRADDLGIRVCAGLQIQQLGRLLADWVG